jgi:hypothetical protein
VYFDFFPQLREPIKTVLLFSRLLTSLYFACKAPRVRAELRELMTSVCLRFRPYFALSSPPLETNIYVHEDIATPGRFRDINLDRFDGVIALTVRSSLSSPITIHEAPHP